ncbi:MAG: hypothetical protein ACR2G0_13140 [Chthoniobacterales bacterium]
MSISLTPILQHRRDLFRRAARTRETILHEGVYAGMLGPQYETSA